MSDQLIPLELLHISKLVNDISELGLLLGYEEAEVEAFEDENKMALSKKKGTHRMLKIWYEKDGSTKAKLVAAFRKAGFGKQADRVLKGILKQDAETNGLFTSGASASTTPASTTSASITSASTTSEKSEPILVTEKQLLRLAKKVEPHFYVDLAVNLGLESAEYENIKLQNQSNLRDAVFRMLLKWSKKEGGGQIVDLDEALRESDCGSFISKYKQSSTTPAETALKTEAHPTTPQEVTPIGQEH